MKDMLSEVNYHCHLYLIEVRDQDKFMEYLGSLHLRLYFSLQASVIAHIFLSNKCSRIWVTSGLP